MRVKRGATIGSDHHLVVASLKIKLAARKPIINSRRKFDVMKLRDPATKQPFQIELQNRFESLFLQEEDEEVRNLSGDGDERAQDIDINALWEKTKKTHVGVSSGV